MKRFISKRVIRYVIDVIAILLMLFVWLPLAVNSILIIARPIPIVFLQALGIALLAGANVMFGLSRAIKETDDVHESSLNLGKILLLSALLIGIAMVTTYITVAPTNSNYKPTLIFEIYKNGLTIVSKIALFSSVVITLNPLIAFVIDLVFSIKFKLNDKNS